jgi:hypothetical protein
MRLDRLPNQNVRRRAISAPYGRPRLKLRSRRINFQSCKAGRAASAFCSASFCPLGFIVCLLRVSCSAIDTGCQGSGNLRASFGTNCHELTLGSVVNALIRMGFEIGKSIRFRIACSNLSDLSRRQKAAIRRKDRASRVHRKAL